MRRFISALGFCVFLLLALSFVLFQPARAKEDPIATLLSLPGPPPPNPLVTAYRTRDKGFYDKFKPPSDDASIEELLDYWKTRTDGYATLGINPDPSERTVHRLMAEIDKNHDLLATYINVLPDGERSANFVKGLLDSEGRNGVYDKEERAAIKSWLMLHTSMYSSELAEAAAAIKDTGEYISSQNELLALTRVDYDKAEPIIRRMNADTTNRVSQVLAKWALYRHAIDTNAIDIDRYRDDLKAVVEDKAALPGMRDLALDALAKEKEWPGRDEWYFSLFGDETLTDLKVNGSSYTGLTTLMYYVPDDKFTERLLELLKSDNKTIRGNAIRNLLLKLDTGNVEIVKALVPWLDEPSWAMNGENSRYTLVSKLSEIEVPESVPGLIRVLNERNPGAVRTANAVTNSNVTTANRAVANSLANAANTVRSTSNTNSAYADTYTSEEGYNLYPLRSIALSALAKQKDQRAVPALRRLLADIDYYEQTTVVRTMIACNGFTVAEEVEGLELAAKSEQASMEGQPSADPLANLYRYSNSNAGNANGQYAAKRAPTSFELKAMVGRELMGVPEIPDDLGHAIVDRISSLDKTNKPLAQAFRKMALRWQNSVINVLMLNDLKTGRAETEEIVKLLSQRKDLREKQSTDVLDIRNGTQTALGISPCLMEDQADAAALIENGTTESKTALLACARLVRLPLPLDKVAANLKSETPILVSAAERYLESEDSPESRNIVLARHPGEARLMGATSAFFVKDAGETTSEMLYGLFQSMGDSSLYNGWSGSGNDEEILKFERDLQDEVKRSPDLLAVYGYDNNFVRIYKDKVLYSWNEDTSRFRERPLTKYEFDEIKTYIRDNKLDELPPFLSCGGAYCTAKELVMLSKNGGRRVYINGESQQIFDGLDKLFADLKKTPGTLKYALGRGMPGLEIVIASDDLHVETVWKDGTELRVAASQTVVRNKVAEDIEKLAEDETPKPGADGELEDVYARQERLRQKREFDGFGWYRITDRGAEPGAAQPVGVEYIPIRDALQPRAGSEQWKTRALGFEIRSSDDGLYKIARGRSVKIQSGKYQDPIVSPNGRWVVATKGDEGTVTGKSIVRIDLATNKEFVVDTPDNYNLVARAYVPSINKILLTESTDYYDEGYTSSEPTDTAPDDSIPDQMMLLDAATGALRPVAGEFRPIAQQTFRALQPTGHANEFWAAIYNADSNATEVGYYETRTFSFRPVLKLPKIKFNSMSMYADESANKLYFVYRGHLLCVPLVAKGADQPLPSGE